ncbi:hypothetical protein [[Eubacterium] cellulosolvens]
MENDENNYGSNMPRRRRRRADIGDIIAGILIFGVVGAILGGINGAILGGIVGGFIGYVFLGD